MKLTVSLLFLSLILSSCSSTNTPKSAITTPAKSSKVSQRHITYLKGVEAARKGKYTEAAKYYKKAADQAHHMAKIDLGVLYFEGKGVPKNYKRAFYWNEQVVKQAPDPRANYNLGQAYRQGLGVKRDYKKAISNYKTAAKMGSVDATNSLGYLYENGLGVKANKEIARDYYIEAATKGNSFAINNLGALAEEKGDYKQARQWYTRAVEKGSKIAVKNISRLNSKGH